jgi:hypothetical protein
MPEQRHFPPPWTVEVLHRPRSQRAGLAYVYFEEEPGTARDGAPAHP